MRISPTGLTALVAAVCVARSAMASPEVSLDDPVYETLTQLRADGRLHFYSNGLRPLSGARIDELLREAGALGTGPYSVDDGWWIEPIDRVLVRLQLYRETARPYSSAQHPRNLVGAIMMSCEHGAGRPCGNGVGAFTELDSSAGYGTWLSGSLRLRTETGTDAYATDVELDRAHLDAELGPLAVELGRDAFVLGPSARTSMAW